MENNINTDISENKYNPFTEENYITEKNKNNIMNKIQRESSLIRSTLNEKENPENISQISDISLTKKTLIEEDEEESKDVLLNLFPKKNKEEKIDEYLKPKLWKYKNKINHKELEEKFDKIKNSMNKEEIRKLNNDLKNKKIYEENEEDEFKMIKLEDLNDIREKDEEKLKENIFVIRKIYKDNNSFYRCVIFSIFENMVLTNNILFFKELLIEIDFIVSSENNRNKELFPDETLINDLQLNIKAEMVKNLLYILIKSMEKSITSSYELLLKLFTDIEIEFDASIILLVRYLLCFYIDENKYKTYSKEEKIDVGDLIPQKYKEMHIFLQKKFELFFIN